MEKLHSGAAVRVKLTGGKDAKSGAALAVSD
jgi:hypothetical protein